MEPLSIKVRTLTPLWLGDLERNSATAKESGLIGSLRFWCEGLVRGYGVDVCDGEKRCEMSTGLCEVCRVFGATGWARRFRLELEGLAPVPVFFRTSPAMAVSSGNWLWQIFGEEKTGGTKIRNERETTYSFGVKALWSNQPFEIRILPLPFESEGALGLLALTLLGASRLGGIGAKTQLGFGQVEVTHDERLVALADACDQRLREMKGSRRPVDGVFSVASDRFFSLLYTFQNNPLTAWRNVGTPPPGYDEAYIPCSFDIRYKYSAKNPRNFTGENKGLRPAIRDAFGGTVQRISGYTNGNEGWASRIHVSHLYRRPGDTRYRLKVWADYEDAQRLLDVAHAHIWTRFAAAGIAAERLA